MKTTHNPQETSIHTGSSFTDFLEKEGIRDEVEAGAMKRVSEWQVKTSLHESKRQRRDNITA
jgi:hypothetical protein